MKKIKQVLAVILSAVIAFSPMAVRASDELPGILEDGMFGVRAVFEALDFTVDWNEDRRVIGISGHGLYITLAIGSEIMTIDEQLIYLSGPVVLLGDRAIAPLREFLEAIGIEVGIGQDTASDVTGMLTEEIPEDIDFEYVVSSFFEAFISGDLTEAFELLSPQMQALGEDFFEHQLQLLFMSMGSYQDFTIVSYLEAQGHHVFEIMVNHTMGRVYFNIVVSQAGQVNGLFVTESVFVSPPVDESMGFVAEPIIVGAGTPWELEGILTMPETAAEESPVPAVVLVHGSGAHNMDSSVFDNRPFFDIASHLSANGVAVLRHNKRNLVYGEVFAQDLGSFTIWEESVEDAILSADILRNDPRVDSDRIFLVGLSQGGMIAPRIQEAGGDFAGFVLMGATPLSLAEVLVVQSMMAIEIAEDDELSAALAANLAMLSRILALLDDMSEEDARAMDLGGMSAYYLRDISAPSFADLVEEIDLPMLILQGSHDFQVTVEMGYEAFREILGGRDNVEFILYQGLNHLFMTSIAENISDILEDYMITGQVDSRVLEDILRWISEQ